MLFAPQHGCQLSPAAPDFLGGCYRHTPTGPGRMTVLSKREKDKEQDLWLEKDFDIFVLILNWGYIFIDF